MKFSPKEYFKNLRLTTMQVTSPLIALSSGRLEMINEMVKFIESMPKSSDQLEILQRYNEFATKDRELADLVRGRIDSNLSPS